jgi:hypothetical protein
MRVESELGPKPGHLMGRRARCERKALWRGEGSDLDSESVASGCRADLDRVLAHADLEERQGFRGRSPQDATVAELERAPMEGAGHSEE